METDTSASRSCHYYRPKAFQDRAKLKAKYEDRGGRRKTGEHKK
jgi:hypothetical protein